VCFASITVVLPPFVDGALNPVLSTPLPAPSTQAIGKHNPPPQTTKKQSNSEQNFAYVALHKELWIADLHSDTLMWPTRDITKRNTAGHVDVPRLIEGNVALQAFTIVTSTPSGLNFEKNPSPSLLGDSITLKAIIEVLLPLAHFLSLPFLLIIFSCVTAMGCRYHHKQSCKDTLPSSEIT